MPSELNTQAPDDIFLLLDALTAENKKDAEEAEIPPGMEWFYGK
jgi:hypothetical protein